MNKKESIIQSALQHSFDEAGISKSIDLWPAIYSSLKEKEVYSFLKEPKMKFFSNRNKRLQHLTGVLVILVLLAAAFFATPPGKTLAKTIFGFFIHDTDDTLIFPTATEYALLKQTPGAPAVTSTTGAEKQGPEFKEICGDSILPRCSIEEIRNLINFQIFQPGTIPDGIFFVGATGGSDRIWLVYQTLTEQNYLIIYEEPWSGKIEEKSWEVGASAEIETLNVDGITVEYVKGAYVSQEGDPAIWDANDDIQTLRWVDQGNLFTMVKLGTTPEMDMDSMAALITTMTTEEITLTATQPPAVSTEDPFAVIRERFVWSVEQVEQEAGFNLHLPSQLPDVLTFVGARFEAEKGYAIVFYGYNDWDMGAITDGLSLAQQPYFDTERCALCGFSFDDDGKYSIDQPEYLLSSDAIIQTVQIGNVSGQYVEGVWKGTDNGWKWSSDPYMKRLRWQVGDMAYEIEYMGNGISMDDMVKIAETIQ